MRESQTCKAFWKSICFEWQDKVWHTPRKTSKCPLKGTSSIGNTSSNHWFSGESRLFFGGVVIHRLQAPHNLSRGIYACHAKTYGFWESESVWRDSILIQYVIIALGSMGRLVYLSTNLPLKVCTCQKAIRKGNKRHSNHPFSGAMLVSGRVTRFVFAKCLSF